MKYDFSEEEVNKMQQIFNIALGARGVLIVDTVAELNNKLIKPFKEKEELKEKVTK